MELMQHPGMAGISSRYSVSCDQINCCENHSAGSVPEKVFEFAQRMSITSSRIADAGRYSLIPKTCKVCAIHVIAARLRQRCGSIPQKRRGNLRSTFVRAGVYTLAQAQTRPLPLWGNIPRARKSFRVGFLTPRPPSDVRKIPPTGSQKIGEKAARTAGALWECGVGGRSAAKVR